MYMYTHTYIHTYDTGNNDNRDLHEEEEVGAQLLVHACQQPIHVYIYIYIYI